MDTQRPQPIVRLQNIATGREIYVMNVHNSPRDAKGREWERDRATAIEIAAIKELRKDNLPVVRARATSTSTPRPTAGSPAAPTSRPPTAAATAAATASRPTRCAWTGSSARQDAAFSGFLMDTGAQVRRITDHAVLSATVNVS